MNILTSIDTQVRIGGTSIAFENELLETTNNVIYKIFDRNKSIWDMSKQIEVIGLELGDSYNIDYANGFIQFARPKLREELLINGSYLTTTAVGKITGYDYTKNRDFIEVNLLGALNPESIPVGTDITGSIDALEIGDPYFLDAFHDASKLLLEFQIGERVDNMWVYIESHGTSHSGNDLIRNNVSFRGAKD